MPPAGTWAETSIDIAAMRQKNKPPNSPVVGIVDSSAALAAAVDGIVAESVELFGSRTDPASRGGDIDVLILTSAPRFETSRCVSSRFFMHCEERIDVVVLDPDRRTPAEDAFLQSLRRVRIT